MRKVLSAISGFFVLLILFGCSNSTDNNNPITNDENVIETKVSEIGANGGTISLSDGSSVVIGQGVLTQNTNITVKLFSADPNFNSSNHKAIDISSDANISQALIVKMKVPENLNSEKISLFNYDPNAGGTYLEGILPQCTYDKTSGIITGLIAVGKIKAENLQSPGSNTRWVAEWETDIEISENEKLIKMPFYEQPGSSCWATCATMLAKSIMPYTDKTKEVEVCNFLQRCGLTRDEGIYPHQFLRTLLSAMNYFTGGGFESTGYFRLGALKEKIISELDNDHPVIINLNYPGVGNHVIMAIGYKKTGTSYTLIYHNPQGTGAETMYMERDIDQVFVNKSMAVAVQILYPKEAPHQDRALYTVGMPLGAVGFMRFEVPYASTSYNINLNEKINASDGYGWFWNQKEFNIIPDTAKNLNISLPLWNASKTDAISAKMNIFIVKSDVSVPVYDKMEDVTINSGTEATWYKLSIPLSQFVRENGSKEYRIYVKLYDNSFNYLDGFDTKVNIEPQKKVVINTQTAKLGTPTVTCSVGSTGTFNYTDKSFDFSKKVGTQTYKIKAEWNSPPSGNFEVQTDRVDQVFWDLSMKFIIDSPTELVYGPTMQLEPMDPTYGFYGSWNNPNEVSFGLYSDLQVGQIPPSNTEKKGEITLKMPITLNSNVGDTMVGYDGQIILRGSVTGVLPGYEILYFDITILYPKDPKDSK